MGESIERIAAILEAGHDPDDALRAAVSELASTPGVSWAGIAFVEEGELVLGPEAGTADASRRQRLPVTFDDETVAELWVDGDADSPSMTRVAELLGPYCLVGWDTGGLPWGT